MPLLTELAGNVAFAVDHLERQERLDRLANYDTLTGLANRRSFLERVTQYMLSAANDGHKMAVFLIDLERAGVDFEECHRGEVSLQFGE